MATASQLAPAAAVAAHSPHLSLDSQGDVIRPLWKQVELLFNTRYGQTRAACLKTVGQVRSTRAHCVCHGLGGQPPALPAALGRSSTQPMSLEC
nr:uncharacterized protein LOC129047383 isoform X1 [Pongo abelii]